MSKYEPLWKHLHSDGRDTFKMTYDEIRAVLGFDIDHSFLTYKKEAAQYGYDVGKISLIEKHVTFNKKTIEAAELRVIESYIAAQSTEIQPLLQSVCTAIRAALPNVTEIISWQMPTFWQGRNLIHFAAQKNHLGIYPGAEAMEYFAPRLTEYKTSKGAVQFPYKTFGEEQLALIAEIAAWCGKNNAK